MKSTIVKITLNQYIVEKGLGLSLKLGLGFKLSLLSHINITLYVCCLFFHSKNNVFGLSFHHLLTISLLPLQVCDFANLCFAKCVFLQLLVLIIVTSFVYCQIHFGKFFFFGVQWLLF